MMDMRTSKYSEEQIIGFFKASPSWFANQGNPKHGFSDASFYKWRSWFGGMDATEAKRQRELELRTASSNGCWLRRTWTFMPLKASLAQNFSFKR